MAPTDYYGDTTSTCGNDYTYNSPGYYFAAPFDLEMLWADIRQTHQAFLKLLAPVVIVIPLWQKLARAGRVCVRRVIQQPRWKAGRWRAKT